VTESLHAIKSLAYQMRAALENGHLDHFGRLLDQGWQWKKQLSAHVSSTSIDRWYDAARAAGALGGKIAGAGGGGHLLLYVPPQRQPAVRHALSTFGLIEVPFSFDRDGAVTVRKERQVRGEMSLPEAALAVKGRI
jgi:D-glycero-alpha-D-manno-heptose-7-phosphate kinase